MSEDKKDYGLIGITHADDGRSIYTHAQDIEPTIEEVKQRQLNNPGGFSDKRTQRYIGSIPLIEIERNPLLKAALLTGDPTIISRAMRLFFSSDEGSKYMANKFDTGKSGKVVVK